MTDDDDTSAAALALQERLAVQSPGVAELEEQAPAAGVDTPAGAMGDPAGRWPPLAHDPRVGSRTAVGWWGSYPQMDAIAGDFERLHLRTWGLAPGVFFEVDATADGDELTGDGGFHAMPEPLDMLEQQHDDWQYTRPGEATEGIRWATGEPIELVADVDAKPRAWELVRLAFQARGLSVLEQLAWAYTAAPLDAGGVPIDTPVFVGTACGDLCNPFARPVHPLGGSLSVRFIIIRSDGETIDGALLAAIQPEGIPRSSSRLGVPRELGPAFAWGSQYTHDLQCILPGDGAGVLRVFVIASSLAPAAGPAPRWRIQATSHLAGWSQHCGPLGWALRSASLRST